MLRFPNALTNIAALLFFAAFFIGCGPKPEFVGATARATYDLDYQVQVDYIVKNRGSDGQVTIYAELNQGGFWKKEQTVFIAEGATQKVTFTFPEPTFSEPTFGGPYGNYKCRVRRGIGSFIP